MRTAVLLLLLVASGCYNAGPYGYDRHYVPLRAERELVGRGRAVVYNEVRTDPENFSEIIVSWFGVVEQVESGEGGATLARLSFRTHQDRHLCADLERHTCRVTVSQASSGSFTARIQLRAEDTSGRNSIGTGSLLRVYCRVTGEYDAEGGPSLDCDYYRHWPRGQWVHTGMRDQLRR